MSDYSSERGVVIFGLGSFSSLMTKYIQEFTDWTIGGYTVDDNYFSESYFQSKPVCPLSRILSKFPPEEYDALIAVGYSNMGDVRKNAYFNLKDMGYHLRNFIHPDASCNCDHIGEGNIILEKAIVSLGTKLGNANLLWCGANIAHDSNIGCFNTFCPSSAFGGFTEIEDNCFFGINSTCKDGIKISSYTFVGAGAYVVHDTEPDSAFVAHATSATPRLSNEGIKRFLAGR